MKKSVFAGAVLLCGLALFAYVQTRPAPVDDAPDPRAEVSTIALVRRTVPVRIPAFGTIIAGAAETNITLPAPGIVTDVLVLPGQAVAAGQALARIAPDAQSAADLRKAQDALQPRRRRARMWRRCWPRIWPPTPTSPPPPRPRRMRRPASPRCGPPAPA